MLDPASPQAKSISDLFNISVLISAIVLALVTGLVVYIAIRYRSRPDDEEPRQTHGHLGLEIGWTVGPALIVTGLFILTVLGMGKVEPFEAPSVRAADVAAGKQTLPPVDLVLVGHQFWWEVRYPSASVVTANEIHLPVGKQVRIQLEAADVVHGLWFPQLNPQLEPIPGQISYLSLQGDR